MTYNPTLPQRLRYIDITFECMKRAQKIVTRVDGPRLPLYCSDPPTERGRKIARITSRLRLRQCDREGIPMPADHRKGGEL